MANYPDSTVTFGSPRVDLVNTVVAEDVNSLYREVVAIASDLGTGNMGVGTPGLRYSAYWGVGAFNSSTTTWTGLQARVQNIENGLYRTYYNSVDIQGRAGFNTIQSVDGVTVGLSIKAGVETATVTYAADVSGTTIDYTANNTFSVGQKVTITGLNVSTGKTLNLSLRTITALIGAGPTYTGFTIVAPSVTGVTGTTSGVSTSLTVVGNITDVVAGMTIVGTNIVTTTKVSSVSGQVVTMDTASTGTVSGSISFITKGTSSGTGTATAYQTTSLQRWQKADGTVVSAVSPDGDLVLEGSLSVTGSADFTGDVSVIGAFVASVIDCGTP